MKRVILDFSGVNDNDMDAIAIDALEEIMDAYLEKKVLFLFAEMKGPVRDLIMKAGWEEKYGKQFRYPSIEHALREIELG